METTAVVAAKPATPVTATKSGTSSYGDSFACLRCYAKHVAKALVLWQEYMEDSTRSEELALCIGNIGCAEDHAAALGRDADRRKLRTIRTSIWDAPGAVSRELSVIAASVANAIEVERIVESARETFRKNALESQQVAGVENTGRKSSPVVEKAGTPARTEEH